MVKFEIDESLEFRGGNHHCFVYADDLDEIHEELTRAWYSTGISRFGGELFLTALVNRSDGEEVPLFLGNCSVESGNSVQINFEPPDDAERVSWYSVGLFDHIIDDDINELINALFDYDNPYRVIGSYLFNVSQKYDALNEKEKSKFGEFILANILDFGMLHDKGGELYNWLCSQQAEEFFEDMKYQAYPATEKLKLAILSAQIDHLDLFINQYKRDLGFKLLLPSTM